MQDQFQNQNVESFVSCFYSFFQRGQEESWYVYTLAIKNSISDFDSSWREFIMSVVQFA